MTTEEMRQAILKKIEQMPEVEIKVVYSKLFERVQGEPIDILQYLPKILEDDHEVLRRLAEDD